MAARTESANMENRSGNMELTEEKLFEAFGLSKGENETEAAEPSTAAQGQEQETDTESTADDRPEETPDERETDEGEGGEPSGEETETDQTPQDAAQTPEQRRANAARRRQQEQQAAIEAAVQRARQSWQQEQDNSMRAFFQRAGLTDPFTNKPITSMEEFNAWRKAQDQATLQQELKSGKLTQETLAKTISGVLEQDPTMQQTRRMAEQQRQAADDAREQQFRRDVEAQLAEIRKRDPSVKTVKDLLDRPYSAAFYAAVQRGNNFLDAFYLATRDQAAEQAAAAARQQAMNNLQSKSHLRRTGVGGKAGAVVTEEERKMYRVFNPDATDEQIQKFQNKVKR